MDHLDLAEVLSTPWLPPYGQQNGDSNYVIRAALEPIIEETSDDDENGIADPWTEMEHTTWSSESETGSVIRVEIHQDQDTISERDFACPAKRRRQDELNDDGSQWRLKPTRDFEFKFKVECCDNLDNFGKRCRLDDYSDIYSDSDSLSFNSLSRSSSLIQFESLERQLQVDAQPYGGSTPALHPQTCYDTVDIIAKPNKRFESSSRNYYDVNKIDFNKSEFLTGGQQIELKRNDGGSNSDSSSDNSDDVMSVQSQPTMEHPKRMNYRGKNSVENLSEDSGYCEYNSLRIRSKSIPNFGHDDFIEEEEFENHKSLENMLYSSNSTSIIRNTDETHSMNIVDINSRVIRSENNSTKIETTKRSSAARSSANDAKNTIDGHCISGITASQNISTSLPDILNHIGVDGENNRSSDQIDGQYNSNRNPRNSDPFISFSIVSSVPNDLNICSNGLNTPPNNNGTYYCSAAAKNFDLCDFETTYVPVESYRQHKVINASYSNLTILDYSGRQTFSNSSSISSLKKMAENRKRNSGEFSRCNFLLDEISAHFNKDLSILNDRTENYDPVLDNFLYAERIEATPPKPPPRKTQPTNKSNYAEQIAVEPLPTAEQVKLTFDRDPTNLVTCYAESMERCNFDARGSSYSVDSINSNSNLESTPTELTTETTEPTTPTKHPTAVKRQMVASTPNLCSHNVDDADDYLDISSSTTVSMNPLPNVQQELHDKKQGILSVGSRNSLGKGVSFCPIVSEISWREQSSDECVDEEEFDDSDEQTDNNNISSTTLLLENSPTIPYRSEVVIATEGDNAYTTPHVNNQDRGTTAEGNKKNLPSSLNPKVSSSNVMIVNESVPSMNGSGDNNRSVIKLSEQQQQQNKDFKRTMETGGSDCKNSKPSKSHNVSGGAADGNDKKNNLPAKPEKKHKSGFLSRLSGFRFSLRGKKKAKVFENNNPVIVEHRVTSSSDNKHDKNEKVEKVEKFDNRSSINKNSDFVYIPLKEQSSTGENATISETENFIRPKQTSDVVNNSHVLTAKPPLPRQPPRVVGLCAKPPLPNNGKPRQVHAQQQRASSAPREIDVNDHHLLSSDHEFYNQFYSETMTSIGDDSGNCDDDRFNESYGFDQPIGLLETDLDTHETVITGKTRSLMELGPQMDSGQRKQCNAKHRIVQTMEPQTRRPHKSMEFLLDKENQKFVLPPENELQKCHDNNPVLSEHQLRVQASLQRLNIPEWYRKYGPPSKPAESSAGGYVPGSFTKKRNSDVSRWTGLNSKTTSLSSLGSNRTDRSPLLLSPSAHSHHGQTGFSRWSTSQLNSSLTSPSASTRGSFSRGGVLNSSTLSGTSGYSARSSIRQPYLGWRSQEKLDNPRTPGERLAARHSEHLLGRQLAKQRKQNNQQEPAVTPEIQSSIKEVTSAIVHFVNDQADRTSRSRSTSPTARKCWLESSFVGNRPLDSPQTPVIDTYSPRGSTDATTMSRLNGVATPIPVLSVQSSDRPSPSSTTLEDVLASLLGLPTDSYRSSDTTLANNDTTTDAKTHLQIETVPPRRRSEGDAQKRADSNSSLRRGSLDSTEFKNDNELVKCRFPKCDSSTTAAEAKKFYKSCHNCSHQYCSRECRRSHWEKHRKACLHSRVSALCRQVLSACKDDADTLRHLSLLARKGYEGQGRGVIRILFRSPESAEAFVTKGFQCIGEASYVRWPELLPQEMGAELYSELLRLSTEYKTDSKMLIYVAICVVSETPGSGAAPVKWERQLVSRCAKLKLSKALPSETAMPNVPNEQNNDILILTFCTMKKNNQKVREQIMLNIQNILKRRGVSIRKHFPEIHQRLNSFVEGTTDKFLPVTIHPRDSNTGRAFICIIMANNGEADKMKIPTNGTNNVQIIDNLESVEWN